MKAIIYDEYGPPEVLKLKEVEKPSPKDNEILIKIHAASVNYGDLVARNVRSISSRDFHMPALFLLLAKLDFGFKRPKRKILGSEFSGEIEGIGSNVSKFKTGDLVFGYVGQGMGAYAEYLCIPETGVVEIKPSALSFEEAAVIPMGAIMALHLLREKGKIKSGDKVLINGASGSIGSAAVQIAKNYFGAEVTGVCGTLRLEFVKSIGANKVFDYTREDFTESSEKYDLIFDVLGKSKFSACKKVLNKNGRYLLVSFKIKQLFQMLLTKIFSNKKVICAIAPGSAKDFQTVKELVETGKLKSIVDKSFAMDQAAQAHSYVEEGHKKSSVVITMK